MVATPVRVKAHHCQLPATPCVRTKLATRFGVSLENVVATIERPASHHGTERPEAKNSEVFLPERRPKKSAGAKQMPTASRAMIQSSVVRCMRRPFQSLRTIRPLAQSL